MIKDLEWLRNKLREGVEKDDSTILILDKIDCKQLSKDIDYYYSGTISSTRKTR